MLGRARLVSAPARLCLRKLMSTLDFTASTLDGPADAAAPRRPGRMREALLLPKKAKKAKSAREALEEEYRPGQTEAAVSGICFVCGQLGHWSRECPLKTEAYRGPRKRKACFTCGKGGHHEDKCPEKYGKPSNEGRGSGANDSDAIRCSRIFVHNLNASTDWAALKDHFRDELGLKPKYVAVASDMVTSKSQQRGIVEFENPRAAARAIELGHESTLDGAKISCRFDQRPTKAMQAADAATGKLVGDEQLLRNRSGRIKVRDENGRNSKLRRPERVPAPGMGARARRGGAERSERPAAGENTQRPKRGGPARQFKSDDPDAEILKVKKTPRQKRRDDQMGRWDGPDGGGVDESTPDPFGPNGARAYKRRPGGAK
ncbi:hypothetical protein M885DRAFT_540546 [Pelagophyceae sp. CCMP2097]|nr:hypothetical protein M885DRAFT_540546 [Pelagophyceae sp. CCMP2097]